MSPDAIDGQDAVGPAAEAEHDQLPPELDASGFVGPTAFPDVRRRRVPGILYLLTAAGCVALWALRHGGGVLVNDGLLTVGVGLAAVGCYHLATAWHVAVSETDALVAASRRVGFPVGHASAQLGWRGMLSRPTADPGSRGAAAPTLPGGGPAAPPRPPRCGPPPPQRAHRAAGAVRPAR